jgi:hypothetical protein
MIMIFANIGHTPSDASGVHSINTHPPRLREWLAVGFNASFPGRYAGNCTSDKAKWQARWLEKRKNEQLKAMQVKSSFAVGDLAPRRFAGRAACLAHDAQ